MFLARKVINSRTTLAPYIANNVAARLGSLKKSLFIIGLSGASLVFQGFSYASDIPDFTDSETPPVTKTLTKKNTTSALKMAHNLSKSILTIELDPVSNTEKLAKKADSKDAPEQIGFGRAVPENYRGNIESQLQWVVSTEGTQTTAFTVNSPEAQALRLALDVTNFPEGVELRFFNPENPDKVFGPITVKEMRSGTSEADKADVDAPQLYWSPVIEGDTIGVEVHVKNAVQRPDFPITIANISHLLSSVLKSDLKRLVHIGRSDDCQIDVACSPVADGPRKATAKILFTTPDGETGLCTATLLTDKDKDSFIPYMITARHCLRTQEVANTVNTYWLFERTNCGGDNPTSVIQRSNGAELIATNANTDFTFLQLNDSIQGVSYAGWDGSVLDASSSAFGVHHPRGDLKKWSQGQVLGLADYFGNVDGNGSHISVVWSEGTTEKGSSGSALFDDNNRFRGNLHGGEASCTNNSPDYYGRFDLTYPSIKQWLWTGAALLTSGHAISESVSRGEWKEYKIKVAASASKLKVELSGLNHDADLYVRKGVRSTLGAYECRPYKDGSTSEICDLNIDGEGTYYIGVKGARHATPFNLIATTRTTGTSPMGGAIIDACQRGQTPVGNIRLTIGEAVCLQNVGHGDQRQMSLFVPNDKVGSTLEIILSHGSGNGNLLHRHGNRPTDEAFDYISDHSGNEERILVENVQELWNYIHVRADTEFSNVTLLVRYVEGSAPELIPSPMIPDFQIVDACEQGQTPVGNVRLTAGHAVCLQDRFNRAQGQMAIYVSGDQVGSTLEILLSHGAGNANLLHRYDNRPTRTTFDHISNQSGNEEMIRVHNVQRGWNYIHVRADTAFSGVTLLPRFIR